MHALSIVAVMVAANIGPTQHAINVTLLHERTLKRQEARAQADAQIIRDRSARCHDAFASAPTAAKEDLADVYFNAISGALWHTDRAGYAAWIARLAPVARADAGWRRARTGLRAEFALADRIYRAGVDDPCDVATAWQANGFDPAAPPAEVTELRALFRRPPSLPRDATRAVGRRLRAVGSRAARRALAALDRGVDEPDAKVIRRGDPVWAALT